jgi:hypothetical protein
MVYRKACPESQTIYVLISSRRPDDDIYVETCRLLESKRNLNKTKFQRI